jgi:4-hydroxy 2-oxovalerate aldolase
LKKGDLTHRDINHILSQFDPSKKTAFDAKYADSLYSEFKNQVIDDKEEWAKLTALLNGKDVLVIAPGSSIEKYEKDIQEFIEEKKPVVISVNFVPESLPVDYAFFSNNKRYNQVELSNLKTIITSNLKDVEGTFKVNYNTLTGAFTQGCNSLILLLKMLKDMHASKIYAAGADGYSEDGRNYYNTQLRSEEIHGNVFNMAVAEAINSMNVVVNYITPSAYDI